jgi:hypothetical protein
MIHIGYLIKQTLEKQGRSVSWFASQLCCSRPNVYKIIDKDSIDIGLLWKISHILHHNFFKDCSDQMGKELDELDDFN